MAMGSNSSAETSTTANFSDPMPIYVPWRTLTEAPVRSIVSVICSSERESWNFSRRTLLKFALELNVKLEEVEKEPEHTNNSADKKKAREIREWLVDRYGKPLNWDHLAARYRSQKTAKHSEMGYYFGTKDTEPYFELRMRSVIKGVLQSRPYMEKFRLNGFKNEELKIYWNIEQIEALCSKHDSEKAVVDQDPNEKTSNQDPKQPTADNDPKTATAHHEANKTTVDHGPKENKIEQDPKQPKVDNDPKTVTVDHGPKENKIEQDPQQPKADNEPKTATVDHEAKKETAERDPKTATAHHEAQKKTVDRDSKENRIDQDLQQPKADNDPKTTTVDHEAKKETDEHDPKTATAHHEAQKKTANRDPKEKRIDQDPKQPKADSAPKIAAAQHEAKKGTTDHHRKTTIVDHDPSDADVVENLKKFPIERRKYKGEISYITEGIEKAVFRVPENAQIILLNFANEMSPGGGYLRGAIAQEEVLLYNSDAFRSLLDLKYVRMDGGYAIPEFGLAYVRNIRIVEKETLKSRLADMMVSACYCLSHSELYENPRSLDELFKNTLMKFRAFLAAAVANAKDNGSETYLLLGPIGTGAFGNDVEMIANIFKKALNSTMMNSKEPVRYLFENIWFVSTDEWKNEVFQEVFEKQ